MDEVGRNEQIYKKFAFHSQKTGKNGTPPKMRQNQ